MKWLWFSYSLISLSYPHLISAFAYPYETMKLFKILVKQDHSLVIQQMTPLNSKDRIFESSYWKVYYQGKKIVGEELFVHGELSYYYVYLYTDTKIIQKGFFWYGIYTQLGVAKLNDQRIKQGFIYKDIPDSYRVFDPKTLQMTYSYVYPNKEI